MKMAPLRSQASQAHEPELTHMHTRFHCLPVNKRDLMINFHARPETYSAGIFGCNQMAPSHEVATLKLTTQQLLL